MSLSERLRLDQICQRFVQAWGERVHCDFTPYLEDVSESERSELFQELLMEDLELRKRHYLPCSKDVYLQLYPQHAEIIESAFPEDSGEETIAISGSDSSRANTNEEIERSETNCVGEYELLEKLGEGGMGIVYKARLKNTDKVVALKTIKPGMLSPEMEQRFMLEARITCSFNHPNLVKVDYVGFHRGEPFFSMELIEGIDLQTHLKQVTDSERNSQNYQRDTAKRLVKVAHAVEYAHQRGVLHRDLKPGNILLDEQGRTPCHRFWLGEKTRRCGRVTKRGHCGHAAVYGPRTSARRAWPNCSRRCACTGRRVVRNAHRAASVLGRGRQGVNPSSR